MTCCAQSLGDQHNVEAFDCRVESLNSWLKREARRARRANTARTYVWTKQADREVVSYFSIAPTVVAPDELSRNQKAGYTVPIPGYLLARLALDVKLHGQGLGTQLLVDAVSRIVGAADAYGGRLIVVDAIDGHAVAFYQRHDFTPVIGNPNRLVLKIATVRRTMGVTAVS